MSDAKAVREYPSCEFFAVCGRTATHGKGLCGTHVARRKRGIDPLLPIRTPASAGEGYSTADGYRMIRKQLQHRIVMEAAIGRPLEPWENVHHINGVKGDNRPENLELWVVSQPSGQRPSDLAKWVVEHYPELVQAALNGRSQLGLNI